MLATIFAYVGCYQIGFGPITWLILSEVFPLGIRASAVSVGTLANFGSNLLVTLLFELERQSLGESLVFLQARAPPRPRQAPSQDMRPNLSAAAGREGVYSRDTGRGNSRGGGGQQRARGGG